MINMKYMNNHTQSQNNDKSTMDIVTLGERGQVVIPAAIREQTGLKPGAKLMVFTKHAEIICLVPTSSMRRLVNILSEQLGDIETSSTTKPETA
jgi:AbrB family looped-hinge helix DNA binding protein